MRDKTLEALASVRGPRHRATLLLFALASGLAGLVLPALATAHINDANGYFYRYYSRNEPANCNVSNTGLVDPVNIIGYQYGNINTLDPHIENESHWGYFSLHSPQSVCHRDTATSWHSSTGDVNEQDGHTEQIICGTCGARAHLREWGQAHAHSTQLNYSLVGVHHEELCGTHHCINDAWETWERHLAGEMATHHVVVIDQYQVGVAQYYRGWWDDGWQTRIGGQHDGQIP